MSSFNFIFFNKHFKKLKEKYCLAAPVNVLSEFFTKNSKSLYSQAIYDKIVVLAEFSNFDCFNSLYYFIDNASFKCKSLYCYPKKSSFSLSIFSVLALFSRSYR